MRATYFISFNAGSTYSQFYPSNAPKVKLTQEPGEMFFRWRVDSFKIAKTVNSTVYATINSYFFDKAKFATDILYQIKENGTLTYTFVAPVHKGKNNTETSVYECNPDPNDTYRNILNKYEYKWHKGTGNPFNTHGDLYYPKADTGQFVNTDFTAFGDVAGAITYTNTTNANKKAINSLAVTVTTNQVVAVIVKSLNVTAGDEPRIRLTEAGGANRSNIETITANGLYLLTASGSSDRVEFSQTDDISGSSGSLNYEIYHYNSYTVDAGAPLVNALNEVLNNASWMNLAIGTPISTFLWNDALGSDPPPTIDTYITANPANDYVIESTANWNGLWIGRTDAWTTAKEDDFQYSLKDIMDFLKYKLRAYWFIDEDGKFRIEHEKYFRDFTAQADLTDASYAPYKPEVDAEEYTYQFSDIVCQLNYIENNQKTEDWIALPIDYDPVETTSTTRDMRLEITTDIKNLIDNSADAQGSGFTLMRTVAMGASYRITMDASVKTVGNFYANAKLGWYYLLVNYFDYFAEAGSGTVNGSAHNFVHVKEFLQQNDVAFVPASQVDWRKPLTLSRGTGWLKSAEYEPETGWADIVVGFNPYA